MSAANQWLNTVNSPLYQSIPKLPICNSHISHNTPCLPTKFFIIFVFNFSWVLEWPQEKKKTMLMQNYGGQQGVLWGICKRLIAASMQTPSIPLLLKYLKSQRAVLWTFVRLNKIVHSRKLTFTEMQGFWYFAEKKAKFRGNFRGKFAEKSADFAGFLREKSQNSRNNRPISGDFRRRKVKIRRKIGPFRGILAEKKSIFEGFSEANF